MPFMIMVFFLWYYLNHGDITCRICWFIRSEKSTCSSNNYELNTTNIDTYYYKVTTTGFDDFENDFSIFPN